MDNGCLPATGSSGRGSAVNLERSVDEHIVDDVDDAVLAMTSVFDAGRAVQEDVVLPDQTFTFWRRAS
jgi:hypothetical protein